MSRDRIDSCRWRGRPGPRLEQLEGRLTPALVAAGPETVLAVVAQIGTAETHDVAALPGGGTAMVWNNSAGGGVLRRTDAAGNPDGADVALGSQSNYYRLTADAAGTVVLGNSWGGGTSQSFILRRIPAGGPAGDFVTLVPEGPHYYQFDMAVDAAGRIAVVWTQSVSGGFAVYLRQFHPNGSPATPAVLVSPEQAVQTTSKPAVAFGPDGRALVVWAAKPAGAVAMRVYARPFNANGQAEGPITQISTNDARVNNYPRAVATADGFAATWSVGPITVPDVEVAVRKLSSAGLPAGPTAQANITTEDVQFVTDVAAAPDGGFAVVWHSHGQDGDRNGVFMREFDAAGWPRGLEIPVNDNIDGGQSDARMAYDAAGGARVVWIDNSYTSTDSVRTRLFAAVTPPTLQVGAAAVNGGKVQRSRVMDVTVAFTQAVTFAGDPAAAFQLGGPNGVVPIVVDLSASTPGQTVAKITFTGPGLESGSLADGNYTLTVLAAQVTDASGNALDGDGNETAGGDYVFRFHRLFGDSNGDRTVNFTDWATYRFFYGVSAPDPFFQWGFDFDGDGDLQADDFAAFIERFNTTLAP